MNSGVTPRLVHRRSVLVILAGFILIPLTSAWALVASEPSPLIGSSPLVIDRGTQRQRGAVPQIRKGWPRRAILPSPGIHAQTATSGAHVDEKLKLWTLVIHPKPLPGSRLDFCAEFTKPASLCIRSMGTPKNHRSPPATLL